MISSNGPLEEKFLTCVEEFWGFGLPKSYKHFLLLYNGGEPTNRNFNFKNMSDGSCVDEFFGFIKSFNLNLLLKQKYAGERVPENTLPIANDSFGNLLLLSVKGKDRGKIYFWDHEMEADPDQGEAPSYDNMTLIADSFTEFIDSLHDISDM